MTEEPLPGPQSPEPLSWGAFIAGALISLLCGLVLNIVAGIAALAIAISLLGPLVGAIPGVGLALLSRRVRRNGFAQGMLVGACFVALVGGICGYNMGKGLDFK